jgi:ribosomal-protein-alanine N-acetyltransferase
MLKGTSFTLCPFARGHADRTRKWMNNEELMQYLDRAKPISEIEHERWLENILQRPDCIFFAMEADEPPQHFGNIWLWSIDSRHRKAEIRLVIGEEAFVGKGLGAEAITLLCTYAFTRLNLNKIYSFVLASNPRANRSFEKAGFQVEGILRKDRWAGSRYIDVYVLGKLNEWQQKD